MNPKALIISLTKDINRFLVSNIGVLMVILSFIFLTGGYDKKEFILAVCLSGLISLTFNLLSAKIMKRKMERIIYNSFERVETQLYFDELTSVYNRKSGINRLIEEMARAKRNKQPLSIAMLDIDNFKTINDTYGHLVGDKVLNHIALLIKNFLRASDIVSRYGGEEFLIILPETDEIKAFMALERVRENIAKRPLKVGNDKLYLTVSIGMAEVYFNDTLTDFIHRADMALLQAKRTGKNRIEIAPKYINAID
ncbi:MAG: GGDEF domain-containing protein [Thermodesulfovibrio sp.]|nr:GGDEF domain-containing protein [Thermodesulfovibrio sp.]MDW7998661.1 GGDEF domain-containing protein [Thermodesulfovibrio sp.]